MRKLLLLIIVVPIIAFGQEENIINYNDIIEIDGLLLLKSDSTPITGKVKYRRYLQYYNLSMIGFGILSNRIRLWG